MNKKTLRIAGWALGLSMAVAGVGVAIGATEKSPIEARADNSVTLSYSGSTTGNMDGTNQAATLGLSATDWSVVGNAGGSNNNVGLNKAGDIRLYYHASGSNTLTVTSLQNWTISTIQITYTGESYNNGKVLVGGNVVSDSDNSSTTSTHAISATSFVLTNGNSSNVQVRISAIAISFTNSMPSVNWESSSHPSEGYTDVAYDFAASAANITNPKWTWSVSPNIGVTIDDADELAGITFGSAGTYTVTAYAEETDDASKHAQATQVIVVTASSSSLALSDTNITLGLSESTTVTPTVTNTGSYTDTEVTVTCGSDLITITGLTDGKVESGSAITITSKTTEGSAVVTFSNNGNSQELAIEVADAKTIVYAFTTNAMAYNSTGSDSISAYTSADWEPSIAAAGYETSGSARGVQFGAAKGNVDITLEASSEMKAYSIIKVDMLVSSNGTGNTIGLTVGDATFKSGANTTVSTDGLTNSTVSFKGNGCGDLVIAISDTHKSVYIKSVILTIELNTSVVTKFVNNYLKMDQYGGDTTYNESRCTENWAAASAAYEKLNSTQKALFVGGDYASAVERFGWWATANGATFNSATGALSAASNVLPFVSASGSYDYALPTILIVGTVVVTASALVVIHKRRNED